MQINKSKKIITLVILIVLALLLSVKVIEEYDFTILSHNTVSIISWLPLTVCFILIGYIIKDLDLDIVNKLETYFIIYPLIHLAGLLFLFIFPLLGLFFINPPLSFAGETISIGFLLHKLKFDSKGIKYPLGMFFCINVIIWVVAIRELSNEYLGGF